MRTVRQAILLPGCFDKVVIRPRRLTPRWLLFVGALTVLSVAAWVSAIAGAGSGTAIITPSASVPAGSSGKWSIVYTAAETIQNGRVRVTVPTGFGAPQTLSSSSEGYVSVLTNEPTGNPLVSVGGQVITIDVDTLTVGNTLTVVYGDDAGGASARATAATAVGPYTFVVASDPSGTNPSPITTSPQLIVIADTPDHIEIAPSDTSVVAGTFAPYRLIVRDQYGNRAPVASTRTVNLFPGSGSFYTTPGHAAITSTTIAAGKTSVRIDYRATLATNGTPHSLFVFTPSGSPTLAGNDQVNVDAAGLSTSQSTITAASPVVADGSTLSSVVVTSKDSFGNPRSGDNVSISADGSAVEVQPGSATDSNGEATGAVKNTLAQLVTVSATIEGQLINTTAPITFIAGPVSAANSTVDATTPVVANGIATSTVTVTAKDANNNPISGQSVTLGVSPLPNTTLTQPGGVTNASGVVTGTLAATTIGLRTVTATIGATSVTDNAMVNFTAGPIADFVWTVDGVATAGVAESVTLTAKDAQGNTVTNFTGTANLSTNTAGAGDPITWGGGGLGTLNNLTGDDATYTFAAGDNGVVTLQVTDTHAETLALTAVSGGANQTSGNIVVSSNSADAIQIVTGNGQSATVATAVATAPDVRVVDQYGNPVNNATVTFAIQSGGPGSSIDAIAGGGVNTTRNTAADGTAACDVWTLGNLVSNNPNVLRASIASGSTPFVDFTATATAGTGTQLSIAPTSQNVTVSSSTILTATLLDVQGNPKSGVRIDILIKDSADGSLASNPGDPNPTNTINATARYGTSDANGKITVLYQAPAGSGLSDVVDAFTPAVGQGSVADRTYTTVASGGTSYRITFVGPASAAAGASFHFKVEAVDGGGNIDTSNNSTALLTPETGTLTFSLSDFGAPTLNIPLVNGTRDVWGRGTLVGNWDITASGSLGSDLDAVTITPGALDHYSIAPISTPVAAGNNFNVAVSAQDQYGNLVTGANNSITLVAWDDVSNSAATANLSVTGAALTSGQVTVGETYTKAEAIRVHVSDSNSKVATSNIVTVTDAGADHIVKVSGDSNSVTAGTGQVLAVQVFDQYNNPVNGATVNFLKLTGGGSIPASATTNATGNAQQTLTTGTSVGTATVKATILDENPPLQERVDFTVTTVAGTLANYLVSPSKTNPVAHEDVTLTISGRDVNNNVRVNDQTTVVTLSKGASSAVLTQTSGTLTNGVFTTTVHDDIAESFIVHAQTGAASGDSPSIVVSNAVADNVTKVSGDASGIIAGTTQPLTVRVRDLYNNTVAGQVVTFSIASAPDGTASITDPTGDPNDGITLTDGAGLATVSYHTASTVGANAINAQILDANPAAKEKVTFTVNTASSGATKLVFTFIGPGSAAAGGSFQFKVEAKDASDNLVTTNNSQITLTPQLGSTLVFSTQSNLSSPSTTFNLASGTRTLYGGGTKAGAWNIAVDAAGLTGDSDQATVTDTGVITSYFLSAAAGAQAGAAFLVDIEARDQYANRVMSAGNVVFLNAVDDVSNTSTGIPLGVTQATLVAGAVTVNETYTKADLIRVHAAASGDEGFSGVVNVSAGAAYRVANLSGDSNSIVAGNTRTLTARVFDQYDNVVAGQLVSFAAVSGGGSVLPTSGNTNAAGDISTVLTTGTTVGTNIGRATILDGAPAGVETADFTVNTVAGNINNYEVTTAKPALIANELTNVTIKARDVNGNYRTGDNTTSIVITKTGNATLGNTSGTLTGGQFTTTVRDTLAQNFTVSAATNGAPSQNGTSPTVTVTNGPAYRVVYVSGSSPPSIPVGLVQPLRTEVRDQWGNTVANQTVRYVLNSSPPGAYVADAVNDTTDGITASVANGKAVARLHTSNAAGMSSVNATILDGSPANLERITFNVTSVAGGIAKYTVQMSATTVTAGNTRNVTVTAYDINDNPVNDTGTQVNLAGNPGNGLVFGTNPVTLSSGVATTTVRADLVQDYKVQANTVGSPSVFGIGPEVTVVPANPSGAGSITASATQNTITANGTSTTTITSGVIRDAFTNQVAVGQVINVSANLGGTIVGGGAKQVDATGRIQFQLQSSTSTGPCTVSMVSALGSATGSIGIAFAPEPNLACDTPPNPPIVVPGASVTFHVQADNASATSVDLSTATNFSFSDGSGHTFVANLAAPQTIPGNGSVTLDFNSAVVNSAFTTASYAPAVTLIGQDQYGSSVNAPCVLPAASLLVTSIEITSIVPASGIVSRGSSTTIAVTVKNNGSQPTTINDVDVVFIPSGLFTIGDAPENGSSLLANASKTFNVPVTVQSGAATGTYQIDASASGTVSGQPVIDNAVAPHAQASIQVTSAASLAYEPATLSPTVVSRGDPYSFEVTIRNNGGGLVVLDSSATRMTFTDGTRTYSAAPSQPFAIAGGGATQTLTFRSKYVPANFTPNSYPVTINAQGTDNGANFSQAVPLTGSNVAVQAPAVVAEAPGNSLSPDTVTKTTTATFTVQLVNTGTATVVLTPATTTIKFASNQYSASLNPTGPTTLVPGTTTLQFLGATVSNAITMNLYSPTVQLTGTENGNVFSQSITLADQVSVQNPPDIAILAMTPSQAQFTTDQAAPIQVHMVVSNTGTGAGANFSSASLKFIHAGVDRTSQFTVSTPSTFANGATLSAGETDEVIFNVSDNAGPMTAGNMTIEGTLVVTDVNTSQPINVNTDAGGKGNLQVMTPAEIAFDAITVSQPKVTASQPASFKVRAIVRNKGGSDVDLNLSNTATHLNFSPTPNWAATVQASLGNGGNRLSGGQGGGEIDTLIFTVTPSGSTTGTTTIDVVTAGNEPNSGRTVTGASSGLGSVSVQSQGTIQVSNVTPSRSTITSGSTVNWSVSATLTNTGQSDIDLNLGAAVGVTLAGATIQPAHTTPATLAGGGITLSGGETDQITISFTTAGTYAAAGSKNITLNFSGKELNSGITRNGTNNASSVIVQQAPNINYVSLAPDTVSKGTTAQFAVTVQNVVSPNGATITLDRSLTRLRFGSNQFNVGLTNSSPVDVSAGSFVALQFLGATVPQGIPNGLQADAQLELHGLQNGVAFNQTINIGGQINVQAAPALNIVSVRPSKSTMTRQQTSAGTVTMVLRNTGGAAVDLDLDPATTHLGFKLLSTGQNLPASEYTIVPPTALEASNGTTLAGGATDSLVFNIAQAGITTGAIIVNGYAGGIDQNSQLPVTDDTFDGGSGTLTLQTAGALSILSITSPRTTATVNQNGVGASYPIKMAVKNIGDASINVSLSLANSSLSFPGTSGWVTNAPTMANGITLTGGETDTLSFLVTTTGGPAGTANITGTVSGTENNTGAIAQNSGGSGSITLQTPALLVVDSVTPSQPAVTASSAAGWDTTIKLHNAGQSAASLTLPGGFTIAVQSSANTPFVKPVDLEEGGVILAGGASGTLVAHATSTGSFSVTGQPRALNVTITGKEVNSNRPLNVNDSSGSVLVQTAPNLVVSAIRPTTVTRGTLVDFEVDVQNPNATNATVHFIGTTRARFASGAFSAVLDETSPDSIVGGQTVTLHFESKLVPSSITAGPYNFNVDLNYLANNNSVSEPEVVNNGVTVQDAPLLFIQQIVTSQPTVTQGQAAAWTADMTVVNNGTSAITLDLSPAKTFLTFVTPAGPTDNSYVVSAPVKVGGGNTLAGGATGQIQFTVTQTGTQTGSIVISGKVEGKDINQVVVTDDTFDGGRGGVVVQTPAVVSIVAIHPTQPQVTETQNFAGVRIILANTGGADVSINLAGTDPAFTPSTGWTWQATPPLAGGGNVLEGGAIDSLTVPAHAGTTTGITRIDATVPWIENNSGTAGTANTTSSGFGQVTVESKADLRVLATVSTSPNPASVNVNQNFNIQVTVENRGQAAANNVVVNLNKSGGSTIQPFGPIPTVPGGQSVAYLVPVKAASSTAASETFTASLPASAMDENSGLTTLVDYSTNVDATAALAIETPAALDILHALPSQTAVTRGQANPWSVTVAMRNPGQSDVNLTPPVAGDLDFSIAGATKLDYIVQPPTKFASGANGWTLAGGATDSLTYTVTNTGQDPGTADINFGVAGTDRNDPTQSVSDTGATSVVVQDVAGLYIESTFPVGTFNHVDSSRDIVNGSFPFEVHVTVQNAGGEDVDSVRVQLTSSLAPNGSTPAPTSFKRQSIAAGASREFAFRITSRSTPITPIDLETFTSTILPGVKSHNNGTTIIPQPPLDNAHAITVQKRADLSLNLFVASPPGSAGGIVGTNQVFALGAKVSNLGTADLASTGTVTLSVPAGFNAPAEPLAQSFAAGDTVLWSFTAPGATQAAANFSCTITNTPNDVNTNAPAFASKDTDTQPLTVTNSGALAGPDVSVSAPSGATDDTLSVGQNFSVRAAINTNHVKNVVATLSLPGGYSVIGGTGLVQNVPNGSNPRAVTYNVNAPALPSASDELFVTFSAVDSITGDPVPSAADTVTTTVVPRTSLSVTASVTAPADATDNTVGIGATFTITALVSNAAGSADAAGPGNLTISMPAKYTLASGTAAKPFTPGTPVQWDVVAAQQPSGPDQITVAITTVPVDENSGQTAGVTTGSANIAMVTEGSAVSVRDVSSAQKVGTPVAPGGATDLDMLAFQIAYNVTDTSVPAAQVDTVAINIVDKNGNLLSGGVVGQTLKRVALDMGGAQTFEVLNPNTNPVLVSLMSGPNGFQVNPDASVDATVLLDLDPSPRATEIYVNVRGSGIVVKDRGTKLGVTDAVGQPLDIKSGSLVVMSSNFQEYAHNYPNPFSAGNVDTKIAYFLDAAGSVTVKIYDITGELVHEESIPSGDPRAQTGPQETTWDGRNDKGEVVRNGVYVCVLNAGGKSAKFRIAVAK